LPTFIKICGTVVDKYSNLTVFKMATVCHLGYSKPVNTGSLPYGAKMRHLAKFHQNRWSGEYADLTVCKMAVIRHFGFLKFKFLTVWEREQVCIIMPNLVKIG